MKIIISKFFLKKFEKKYKGVNLDDLIKKINIKSKNFISLKIPFFKLKISLKEKTFRILVNFEEEFLTLIFINIFDKKDKNFGENISWNLNKKEILNWYEKNLDDIESGKYKIIEKI